MVHHADGRQILSFLQYAFMSTFLVTLLKENHYFDTDASNNGDGAVPEDDVNFIGGLILRNLQVLQFNSHEIFGLLKLKNSDKRTVAIGAGLYATLFLKKI